MTAQSEPAVIAKRADSPPVETREFEGLVEAAGYSVEAVLTQVRPEDPGTHLGRGKVAELVDVATSTDATLIAIDGELTSGQARNLRLDIPEGSRLVDRYRLVLDIFASQAQDPYAKKQVELARLRYELDWFNEVSDESLLTKYGEKGSLRYQLQDRITALERELNELPDPSERVRRRRSEDGFDLVTIAGYTNAGKSTLLHRLADDLSLEETLDVHPDKDTTAAIENRLFKTLQTTTRRATLDGRPVLCTDTVGYVSDLPHNLVVAFAETLSEASVADLVVLVTEATDDPDRFTDKLEVARDVLETQGVSTADVLPVLNKIDLVEEGTIDDRLERLSNFNTTPIPISAWDGENLDTLEEAIVEQLSTQEASIELAYGDDAMSFVSEVHERASVSTVEYADDTVRVEARARPSVIEELTNRAVELGGQRR